MARPKLPGKLTFNDIAGELSEAEKKVIEQIAHDLETNRQATIDRLAQLTGTLDIAVAQQILAELEAQQQTMTIVWQNLLIDAIQEAWEKAGEMPEARAAEVGLELTTQPFISNTFLQVSASTLPVLIRGLQDEFIADVGRMLRQAVLANGTPLDVIRGLSALPPFQVPDPANPGHLKPLTDKQLRQAMERKGPHAKLFRRLESIARTEIGRIAQTSNYLNLRELSTLDSRWQKEWSAVHDGRTRMSHLLADGQRRKVDEPFDVGGAKLAYPGDPRGPADEVINCRCVSLPYHPAFDDPSVLEDEANLFGQNYRLITPTLKVKDIRLLDPAGSVKP